MLGNIWTLQHDNSPAHSFHFTAKWLDTKDVNVMKWPAQSPDLNFIEKVWGALVWVVYKNGVQYKSVSNLTDAIFEFWLQPRVRDIQKLYE